MNFSVVDLTSYISQLGLRFCCSSFQRICRVLVKCVQRTNLCSGVFGDGNSIFSVEIDSPVIVVMYRSF